MSRPSILLKNTTQYWTIRIYDSSAALIDADSNPTVSVRKNGAAVGDSVTVTKRTATTGIYDCSYNPSGEVEGDKFTIEEAVEIASAPFEQNWEFSITASPVPEPGTGARTVVITVTDGVDPIENARVRITLGATTYVGDTDVDGEITFGGVDDGSWTVAITSPGFAFAGATLLVDDDESETYAMTANSISPPADPSLATGFVICYGTDGLVKQSVRINAYQRFGPGDGGYSFSTEAFFFTSDETGLAEFTGFVRGATYVLKRSTAGKEVTVLIPDSSTFMLPELLGQP